MRRATNALLLSVLLLPAGGLGTAARVVGGGVVGLAAGTAVALGGVVARARFDNAYIESVRDIVGLKSVPIPAGLVAGGAAGLAGGSVLAGVTAGTLGGAVVGAGAGAVVGALVSSDGEDRWVGGVLGGALGVLLGFVAGWVLGRRGRGGRRVASKAAAGVMLVILAAACGPEEPPAPEPARPIPEDAAPVEDVVILVGDPGKARFRHYPVFPRIAADVGRWAERIGRDSAVTVLVLGDIVYPDGMNAPGSPEFAIDSARVSDQVDMVRAPAALARDARMYMVAGNHDWGLAEDREGARRLSNLGRFVDRERERGANVDLAPPAGSGVPAVVDVGDRLRLVLLDTAWWLFDAEPEGKQAFIEGVRQALAGAGARRVVIAAHHPYQSAGPHGGYFSVGKTLGIRYLLYRTGALLQDLNSRPYREMRRALGEVFRREGRPLAFAGGHEHSLQVLAHDEPTAPRYSVVSGSASKLTGVGPIPGTLFERAEPGYVQLLIRENGAVDLEVVAAPARYLACPEDEPAELEWERCMQEGEAAFRSVFTTRLVDPDGP